MMRQHVPKRHTSAVSSFSATLLLLVSTLPLAAQQRGQVNVQVLNGQSNEPLPAVQILIRGTSMGGLTNNEGRFQLANVPAGQQTVVAQLIGYGEARQTVTVPVEGTVNVRLQLYSRAVELEGIVVTGTAIAAQRREIGNSISLITADQIQKINAVNFEDILRGRALGVSVSGTTGTVGAGSEVILRGVQSVNGRSHPLIYVDGVRVPSDLPEGNIGAASEHASFLGSLDPADIVRIEVT